LHQKTCQKNSEFLENLWTQNFLNLSENFSELRFFSWYDLAQNCVNFCFIYILILIMITQFRFDVVAFDQSFHVSLERFSKPLTCLRNTWEDSMIKWAASTKMFSKTGKKIYWSIILHNCLAKGSSHPRWKILFWFFPLIMTIWHHIFFDFRYWWLNYQNRKKIVMVLYLMSFWTWFFNFKMWNEVKKYWDQSFFNKTYIGYLS
jgi:hypothetical protein